jgi:hypothetical protein
MKDLNFQRWRALQKVLDAQLATLVASRSDEKIVADYRKMLAFLRASKFQLLDSTQPESDVTPLDALLKDWAGFAQNATLNELEAIVSSEDTTRRQLEVIAIERFSVPKGSMRSYVNRERLVEKLLTLIRNEGAHETIGKLAHD